MQKLVVSKTILFIFILLFVTVFKSFFGDENTLIAVTTVIAMLMYLERDLTVNPWRNFFILFLINVSQGILGYIATVNMWLAIPLNFIAMFIVGYFFSYNLKKPLYIAYGLQYLFILTVPVPLDAMPMRLLSLISGVIIIIVVQLLINKNKLGKAGNKYLIKICDDLLDKLTVIETNQDSSEIDRSIEKSIKEFRTIIYYRGYHGYYLSNEGRIKLKISVCLEKIYMLLNQIEEVEDRGILLQEIRKEMKIIKDGIVNGKQNEGFFCDLSKKIKSDDTYILEISGAFELLSQLIDQMHTRDKNDLNKIEKLVEIPKTYTSTYIHINNINTNSVKFTYAFRLGIVIALGAFIIDYFELANGKWLIFTLFSVTQPYSEIALFRFKERVIGTIIGVITFLLLFSAFTDTTMRSFLVLLAGYLNSYAVAYRNIVWTVTIAALGSAALMGDPNLLSIDRLLLVLLGVIIGMFSNRFIMPHSIGKGTKNLMEMYINTTTHLMKEIYEYLEKPFNAHSINNLFVLGSLIEDRIVLNNETLEIKQSQNFINEMKKLNHAIYELFLRIQMEKIQLVTLKLILDDLDKVMKGEKLNLNELEEQLHSSIRKVVSLEDYIILKDILSMDLRQYLGHKKVKSFSERHPFM